MVVHFAYAEGFRSDIYRISPFKVPIDKVMAHCVDAAHQRMFWGLHGVFGDSLPDGWGLLLIKRSIESQGKFFSDLSGLDLLSFVGRNGLGALRYEPIEELGHLEGSSVDLIRYELESQKVLEGEASEVLDALFLIGGSPGGARPKVLANVKQVDGKWIVRSGKEALDSNFSPWIIKFKGVGDSEDTARVEFLYMKAAEEFGLNVPEYNLFETEGRCFFGTKRFDVGDSGERFHLHSLAGMLHADFRTPSLDYKDFLAVISRLTSNKDEVLKGYRLAVFNALFHNHDDHGKNFSFLMNRNGKWDLAPVYDLTFSRNPRGEHATSYCGIGKNIEDKHLLQLAESSRIQSNVAKEIIDEGKKVKESFLKKLTAQKIKNKSVDEIKFFLAK